MNLLPRYDKVIVRATEPGHDGVIEVIRRKEDFPEQGEVVAFGPKVEDLAVGDSVIFRQGAGTKIRHDGEELLAMAAEDIYAVVQP